MRSLSGTTKNQAFLMTLRARRRELRIPQKVLAYDLGMTQAAYAFIEQGATDLKLGVFIFLCNRLEINAENFVK